MSGVPRSRAGGLAGAAAPALAFAGCSDLQIGSPDSLWLLWLVPVTIAFYVYVFRTKRRLLARFAASPMLARLTGGVSRPRQVLKALLVLAGLLAIVLALAELKYGFSWEEVRRQGVDIVVALDVSDSMLVEDAESGGRLSRLERAKREISDLLDLLEGDRIGLVAFAGTAFVECPLTLDYAAAEIFLDTLDTDLIPVKGTDLGEAIRTSLEAFEGATHQSKAIILITDGEDHGGSALALAEEAKAAGVRIFTIGIGRDEGAPIPAAGGGFRRDRRGEIVLSRLDEPALQKVALETGGSYVRSVTGDVDLEKIYSQGIKAVLEDQELGSRRRQRWEDRFQWLLATALVALMLEPLVSERRGGGSRSAAALALLAVMGWPAAAGAQGAPAAAPVEGSAGTAPASPVRRYGDPYEAYRAGAWDQALQGFVDRQVERPEDPVLALNVGASHFRMGNWADADRALTAASLAGDPAVRAEALYALGNSAYRQGRLEEAVERYKSVLEIAPDDDDAKFNLEFVRDEIRRRHEEAQKRQQQGDRQEQQGDPQEEGDPQQGEEQQQADQQEGSPEQGDPQSQNEGGSGAEGPDRDGDGLPDEVERSGRNPTDPENPDTDGDGLADGQEDFNRNGSVDEGETDPNQPDTDGDGVPDAAEAPAAPGEVTPEMLEGLSPEEAERYLQALEEGRPEQQRAARGRVTRPLKDW